MADPEEYRTKEQVEEWRRRDPIEQFFARLDEEGVLDRSAFEELDRKATERVDEAVAFADESPFPTPESVYDNVYVLGDQLRGWYSIDERGAGVRKGEDVSDMALGESADMELYEATVEEARDEQPRAGEDEKPTDEAQDEDDG
jgi:hypothetical protein